VLEKVLPDHGITLLRWKRLEQTMDLRIFCLDHRIRMRCKTRRLAAFRTIVPFSVAEWLEGGPVTNLGSNDVGPKLRERAIEPNLIVVELSTGLIIQVLREQLIKPPNDFFLHLHCVKRVREPYPSLQ
jgi:hypothetical protein